MPQLHFTAFLLLLTWVACSESRAESMTGDFNGSNTVDFVDFFLFADAFRSTDPVFDLDGNGRVDFEDLFLFSDHFGEGTSGLVPSGKVAPLAGLPEPDTYTAVSTQRNTILQFPSFRMTVQNGHPFGIVSLRLIGQPVDFVHPALPMGDWEWFWFERPDFPGERVAVKLVQAEWRAPVVERRPSQVVLRFGRRDFFQEGIFLGVTYRLRTDKPEFEIEYSIHNQSIDHLRNPYVMLGFPGFSDHRWISQVANGTGVRPVKPPHLNFISEAWAAGRPEYLLLRQDMEPHGSDRELKNTVSIRMKSTTYSLSASYVADPHSNRLFSAHTNKPRYLTSHLYAFLKNIAPGASRILVVRYKLSSDINN